VARPRAAGPRPAAGRDNRRQQRLLRRHARFGDPAARAELFERFQPLAHSLARRYHRPGEPMDDLAQVAGIGLLKALDRFDPERGVEFSTFAVPTILGELKRYFRDFSWVMHLPRPDQELVLEVNRATEALSRQLGRSPTPQEVARNSRLTVEDVICGLEMANAARPESIDAPARSGDESPTAWDWLGCEEEGFDRVESRDAVAKGLRGLSAQEHEVLFMRFFEDRTQAEIAERIGVSQMQVSRILRRTLERLRRLTDAAPTN
jgi:RNA polymerase sigma-B factor